MVNKVLELLKMDVKELIMADNITAISRPRKPMIKQKILINR